jgi:N-acetylmuramoyl-L-alanine amidase
MSASPTNAPQGLIGGESNPALPVAVPSLRPATESGSNHEALQALLAFSSLHEQIRQRRAHGGSHASAADAWEVERFVLDEVLQLVAERALAITGADGVAIALAEGEEIVCRGSAGGIAPDAGARLDPNSGFSGVCFRSGQIIRCDDAEHDPRVNLQAALLLGARSMVAVPLAGQNCTIGLLEAFSYDAYGFNDSDVRSLNLLAELILAALRPEEEDRLAEISRQVITRAVPPPAPIEIPIRESQAATVEPEVRESAQSESLPPAPSVLTDYAEADTSRPGLRVVLIVVLIAVALGAGVWWKFGHQERAAVATPAPAAPVTARVSAPATAPLPASSQDDDASSADPGAMEAPAAPTSTDQALSVLPRVTGVRHWSSADSSTVVIDLQDQVQYEAHRLANPERIYFDLHDTALAAGLSGKTIEVGDAFLTRIRIAQPVTGVSRIVLDTKGGSNFSVSLEPNPYRLVVEVRGIGSKPQPRARIDLFSPAGAPPDKALSTLTVPTPATPVEAGASDFRIVLDAGHGGWDLGTVGRQGLLEKDLALDIVERLGAQIKKHMGADVIYTRNDDTYIALEKRAEIANEAQADLFVSIHANYSSSASARGVETYYTNTFSSVHAYSHNIGGAKLQSVDFANIDIRDKVQESRKIAADIQHALYSALAAKSPGIRNRGVKEASYVVLTGTSMPAVLAEVSFVSSPADETKLESETYRQGIAEALYKGIARYVNGQRKLNVASNARKAATNR